MIESAKSNYDVPLEAAIPEGAVPLESILCTEELHHRPSRPPDYEKENRALVALTIALADSPRTILHTLAEKALEVLQADSAGLSLLTKDEQRFYWAAIAGAWQPHLGGGTPRDFGPCGDVLDRNVPLLFTHWERRYPYLCPATPLAEEGLLVPFCVHGKAVGTIWAIAHTEHRKFDAEDLRLLESLGRFASAAYQALASIDDLTVQIAAREKAEAAVRELANGLEAKLRRLVDANIIGICLWHLDGQILEANDAFLCLVGYDREELASGRVSWREGTSDIWRAADERALAELAATGSCTPFEKEYVRKDGRRVPVLVGAAVFEGRRDEGVAFVLDLTDRKRAEEALRQAQAELAHVTRVATLGELTASIAHEINQPLAAIVNSANACVRWLAAQNLEKAHQSALRIVADGQRAGDIITRIRALAQKAPPHKDWLDINAMIRDVLALARSEMQRHRVVVETHFAEDVPLILADRIQLQQVLLNLFINAIEAMSSIDDGPRELLVRSSTDALQGVLVAVHDSGPGLDPQRLDRLFDAFYTTKPHGLGLGLAISRRLIEAHGGRLWATANTPHGAVVQFTVPWGSEGVV
jgi:PAS domain S-box-containing protein